MSDQGLTRRSVLRGTALGILGAALPATETVTASPARAAAAPLTLTVNTAQPGHAVSPDLYGAFFEEINYAGVGGIYAELIRNRAFMDPATPAQWVAPGDIPRVPGKFGSALQLNGGSPASYVQLPQGIVTGLTDFTIAAWVNPAAVTVDTRWNWKQTIGPVWERPGHQNSAWGYWSDDGLGLLEYLQLAEDLGAAPVMAVWAGLALNGTVVAQADLGPYVQDALDQIEYAIGPVTSTWGARRAADGHPKPFAVPYVEVGNEDFLNGGTASYNAYRYPMFYDAIKAAYPQVKIIATTPVTSRPMDVIDQHYYNSAEFFEQASTMFDSYDRSGPLVFVGEYSATANAGGLPTGLLGNSIGEAAFMTGMERNSEHRPPELLRSPVRELCPHAVEPRPDRLRPDEQFRVDLLLGPADVRAQRRRQGAAGHRQRHRPVLLRDHRQPERPGLPEDRQPGFPGHAGPSSASAGATPWRRASRCSPTPTRRPATRWRPRTPWCRPAVRCTAPRASSATWCPPTR